MSIATTLYTPQVLGLATELAAYPLGDNLTFKGAARSPVCGSAIEIAFELDGGETIDRIGMKVHACAIGQAAAAIFAKAASGNDREKLSLALGQIEDWLSGKRTELPDWPGLEAIAAARDFPGRHGAILLPWRAALDALP
ncbi:iron-sulfur cluster assembly scaffold protein [Novosphingobium sp. NPDC080210]|uniref:iron-sulfur cluster assembly scaffold protein n=1 Tax=Novosphingobium sp. NPDC080210 TaxID=3390596 RepID=UPI003D05E839